jgi:UPF0755 protein
VTDEQRAHSEPAAEPGPGGDGQPDDLGSALGLSEHGHRHRGDGPGRKRAGGGCILLLVLILLMGGVAYVGLTKGVEWARDQFAEPADYTGAGTTPVLIEVAAGDTADQIGVTLKEAGVVQSAEAYIAHARAHPDESATIQVGFYELRKKMSAADAFTLLTDPANIRTSQVPIPEGLRVVDIVAILAEKTGFKKRQFEKALQDPAALGLPPYAGGNAEGYLFPATYAFSPNDQPADMLRTMVDRWKQAAAEVDLEGSAKALGYTPHELMTVASLVEAEGRGDDMNKIARVIYNRIENPGTAGTIGRLQIDATVNYALGRTGVAHTSNADLEVDSPYNTYRNAGLPPGPIEAPGDEALAAAAHPADGDWYYYVTVNLATGETKFASSPEEFQRYKNEFRAYCANESERC